MQQSIDIFEYLTVKSGLNYISDLTVRCNFIRARGALRNIPEHYYSLKEWKDLYNYVSGRYCKFNSIPEIKNALMKN